MIWLFCKQNTQQLFAKALACFSTKNKSGAGNVKMSRAQTHPLDLNRPDFHQKTAKTSHWEVLSEYQEETLVSTTISRLTYFLPRKQKNVWPNTSRTSVLRGSFDGVNNVQKTTLETRRKEAAVPHPCKTQPHGIETNSRCTLSSWPRNMPEGQPRFFHLKLYLQFAVVSLALFSWKYFCYCVLGLFSFQSKDGGQNLPALGLATSYQKTVMNSFQLWRDCEHCLTKVEPTSQWMAAFLGIVHLWAEHELENEAFGTMVEIARNRTKQACQVAGSHVRVTMTLL